MNAFFQFVLTKIYAVSLLGKFSSLTLDTCLLSGLVLIAAVLNYRYTMRKTIEAEEGGSSDGSGKVSLSPLSATLLGAFTQIAEI